MDSGRESFSNHERSNAESQLHDQSAQDFRKYTQDSGVASLFPTQNSCLPLLDPEIVSLNFTLCDDQFTEHKETADASFVSANSYIEDMEPEDHRRFEYSYRPADLVELYYKGPSHWKLLTGDQPKCCPKRRKKCLKATFNDVLKVEDSDRIGEFSQTVKPFHGVERIQPHFDIPDNILRKFMHSSLSFGDPISDTLLSNDSRELNDENMDHDDGTSFDYEPKSMETDSHDYTFLSQSTMFRSQNDLRAKMINRHIDMKKIKRLSLEVVNNESQLSASEGMTVKFSQVFTKVKKLMENSADTSCALTFFGLLQAANDRKISLEQQESIQDFDIKPIIA